MFPHGHPISTTTACAVTAIALAITAVLTGSTPATATPGAMEETTTVTSTTEPTPVVPPAPTIRDSRPTNQPAALTARSREFRAAVSPLATKMVGIKPSLYRGKYFKPKKGEDFRLCVIERESKGHYKAANRSSSARGAYQFLDSQWRESLIHMLRPEARKNGLLPQLRKLSDKPIHKWSRYWQDAAFWTVYNGGEGAKHWGTFGRYRDCGS